MSSDPGYTRSLTERSLPYVSAVIGLGTLVAGVWLLTGKPDIAIFAHVKDALRNPDAHWGLSETYLLFALPFGASIVVFVRTILGWKTFGLFTPMLLAVAYLQSGPLLGPAISLTAILIGMLCAPLLKWLHLSRVAFLGALISIVVGVLGAMAQTIDDLLLASAFPVVVTALIVERWWSSWETQGPRIALKETLMTLFVAVIIQFAIASPWLQQLYASQPIIIPFASALLMVLLGRYQGLRLSEITRFRLARSK
jgi:hypothetical protein